MFAMRFGGILRSYSASLTSRSQKFRLGCSKSHTATPMAVQLVAPTEHHLQQIAATLAKECRPGDCYCLYGAVGAGKSVFSRAFIRAVAQDPELTVPSPTFLLQLVYDEHEGPPIHHYDLYRLTASTDMNRLDLAQSFNEAVSLLEWADRLQAASLPDSRLDVRIDILDEAGQAQWQECLASAAILSTSDSTANTQAAKPTSAAGIGSNHTPVYDEVDLDVFQTAEGHQQEQEEDPYTDKRWRQITLQPYGRRWQDRIDELRQHWRAHHQSVPQQQASASC